MAELDELDELDQADELDDKPEAPPSNVTVIDHRKEHLDEAAAARRLAGYVIAAGVVLAGACVLLLVWEQWQANREALDNITPFPVDARPAGRAAPDPGSQDGAGSESGPEGAEG